MVREDNSDVPETAPETLAVFSLRLSVRVIVCDRIHANRPKFYLFQLTLKVVCVVITYHFHRLN